MNELELVTYLSTHFIDVDRSQSRAKDSQGGAQFFKTPQKVLEDSWPQSFQKT